MKIRWFVAQYVRPGSFGGPHRSDWRSSGFSTLSAWSSWLADSVADGEVALEITGTHVFGDAVVLIMIELQHGRVADLPDKPSLAKCADL